MNTPVSVTIPNRRPYVRDLTYLDNLPASPDLAYFEGVRAHVGAIQHARTGWGWGACPDDFTALGVYGAVESMYAKTLTPANALALGDSTFRPGDHGVLRINLGTLAAHVELIGNEVYIPGSGDFLLSAKVRITALANLDALVTGTPSWGLRVGFDRTHYSQAPAFLAGGDRANWWVTCSVPDTSGTYGSTYVDTGIPILDEHWYVLQICQSGGAERFFINGRPFVVPNAAEPNNFAVSKYIDLKRSGAGMASDGVSVDYIHLLMKRSV